ncbi:hypothetical protein [Bacillus sp. FSL K6-3431]|uniref:hypothetical protein n=1 Tax=Bacillus sp. FSL K6-3431 TaxID=2921500 RepID=UPI0030F807CD
MYYSVRTYYTKLYGSISPIPYIWSKIAVGAVAMLIIHKPMPVEVLETRADKEHVRNEADVTG